MENLAVLNKLQQKCNIVNKRYAAGLNDDDQVRAMFNYEKKVIDIASVIIGYDDYQAILKTQLIDKFKKANPEEIKKLGDDTKNVWLKFRSPNFSSYKGRLTNEEFKNLNS